MMMIILWLKTLGSFPDSALDIRLSSVTNQIHLSLNYTSSSPSPIPSSYWLVDEYLTTTTNVLSDHEEVKIFVYTAGNYVFLWLAKTWNFGILNWILWDTGQSFLNPTKLRVPWESGTECDIYARRNLLYVVAWLVTKTDPEIDL